MFFCIARRRLDKDRALLLLLQGDPLHAKKLYSQHDNNNKNTCTFDDAISNNNNAVCEALSGNFTNACSLLEDAFREMPLEMLFEPVVSNMSTVYEHAQPLSYEQHGTMSGDIRRRLGAWVAAAAPDDFILA
jgi:hypothetical protein